MRCIAIFLTVLFFAIGVAAQARENGAQGWQCDQSPLLVTDVRLPGETSTTSIFIANGYIEWIGAAGAPANAKDARILNGQSATLLPGLIDSHTHFDALPAAKHLQSELDVQATIFPITMRQTLRSGVTTARAHLAALADMALMKAVSEDDCFPAPRIILSGPGLLGGAPNVNARLMRGVADADDAAMKVQELAARGAEWVALHNIARFSDDELNAIVEAAAVDDILLMADTDSFVNFEEALKWPIVSAEYINRSLANTYPNSILSVIKARGAELFVTPPIGYYARSHEYAQSDTPVLADELFRFVDSDLEQAMRESFSSAFEQDDYIARAIAAFPTMPVKFKQLRKAGATPIVGSDTGSLGQFHADAIWREMAAWRSFGVTAGDTLEAATQAPARMLGKSDIGVIKTGARGDLVLYASDISSGDFDQAHVAAVIKGGVVFVANSNWVGPTTEQMQAAIPGYEQNQKK